MQLLRPLYSALDRECVTKVCKIAYIKHKSAQIVLAFSISINSVHLQSAGRRKLASPRPKYAPGQGMRNNEDAIKEVEQQTATYRKQLTLGLLSIIVQSENVHDNVTSKATAGREQES